MKLLPQDATGDAPRAQIDGVYIVKLRGPDRILIFKKRDGVRTANTNSIIVTELPDERL